MGARRSRTLPPVSGRVKKVSSRTHFVAAGSVFCYAGSMSTLPISTLGMRHVALRVSDVSRSKRFYGDVFGMAPVWEPDDKTAYLSSGSDNLALHQVDDVAGGDRRSQSLDHLGFLVASPEAVYAAAEAVRARGERILQEPRRHRDGSHSFYMADPDGVVVQVLFEPNVASRAGTP